MKRIPLTQQVRAEKLTYTVCSITYVHTKRSTDLSRIIQGLIEIKEGNQLELDEVKKKLGI